VQPFVVPESAPSTPESGQPASPITKSETPDWLKELQSSAATPAKPEEEHISQPPPIPQPEAPAEPEFKESDIPTDWLEEAHIPGTTSRISSPASSNDIPDWLKEIEISPEGEESLINEAEPKEERTSSEMPDWLKDLQSIPEEERPEEKNEGIVPPAEPSMTPAEELPVNKPAEENNLSQWLSSLERRPEQVFRKNLIHLNRPLGNSMILKSRSKSR